MFESEAFTMREDLANNQGHFHQIARAPEVIARIFEVQPRHEAGVLPRDLLAAPISEESQR